MTYVLHVTNVLQKYIKLFMYKPRENMVYLLTNFNEYVNVSTEVQLVKQLYFYS